MKRGFSLLETVLATGFLALVTLLAFSLFGSGSRSLQLTVLRQDLQTQAQRTRMLFDRDVRRGSELVLSVANGAARQTVSVFGGTVQRDALAVATLDDWLTPASYDPVDSRPLWDQYVVYYATTEPEGRLIRQVIQSGAPPYTGPLPLGPAQLDDDPAVNAGTIVTTQVLATSVDAFEVLVNPDGIVEASLRLRRAGMKRPDGAENADESLELDFFIRPENSPPS